LKGDLIHERVWWEGSLELVRTIEGAMVLLGKKKVESIFESCKIDCPENKDFIAALGKSMKKDHEDFEKKIG